MHTLFLGALILVSLMGLVVGIVSLSISSRIFSSEMMGSGWLTSMGLAQSKYLKKKTDTHPNTWVEILS
jgi:hypothetical protein